MLAALVALALSGAFGSVGVLGQLFVGPTLPAAGAGSSSSGGPGSAAAARGFAAVSLPVVPAVAPVSARSRGRADVRGGTVRGPVLSASRGTGVAGGAIGATGGGVGPVRSGGAGSGGGSAGGSPSGGAPSPARPAPSPQPAPTPTPAPQTTPVDTAVKVVTSVTQQLPAPVGPAATQTVEAAGATVDSVLPQTAQP